MSSQFRLTLLYEYIIFLYMFCDKYLRAYEFNLKQS